MARLLRVFMLLEMVCASLFREIFGRLTSSVLLKALYGAPKTRNVNLTIIKTNSFLIGRLLPRPCCHSVLLSEIMIVRMDDSIPFPFEWGTRLGQRLNLGPDSL